MFQPIRGQGGHLWCQIGTKNTNLVEDFEYLLPVQFHKNLFRGCRGEVENVSANQRLRRPYLLTNPKINSNLCRGSWVLASCKVSSKYVQWLLRRSQKCLWEDVVTRFTCVHRVISRKNDFSPLLASWMEDFHKNHPGATGPLCKNY